MSALLGYPADHILRISAKDGTNVDQLLERHRRGNPAPERDGRGTLQALIFDSHYDSYKGVVAYIRVTEGEINPTDKLRL